MISMHVHSKGPLGGQNFIAFCTGILIVEVLAFNVLFQVVLRLDHLVAYGALPQQAPHRRYYCGHVKLQKIGLI